MDTKIIRAAIGRNHFKLDYTKFFDENKMAAQMTSSLKNEERIDNAANFKEEGNKFFKENEYRQAIKKYHFSLLQLKGIGEKHPVTGEPEIISDEVKKIINDITFGCYNNLAACFTKQEKWERVTECCNKALDIHPNNVKALFRKGQACYNMKDLDNASDALQSARKLEPNDANIIKLQTALGQQLKKHKEKEKAMYAGMFGK